MSDSKSHQPDFGIGEKSLNTYLVGFIACSLLTLLPFGAVMLHVFYQATTVGIVVACAVAQFIIQIVCFLRLNYQTEQSKMNMQSFIYCLAMVFILIVGSLWIMANLNYYMVH